MISTTTLLSLVAPTAPAPVSDAEAPTPAAAAPKSGTDDGAKASADQTRADRSSPAADPRVQAAQKVIRELLLLLDRSVSADGLIEDVPEHVQTVLRQDVLAGVRDAVAARPAIAATLAQALTVPSATGPRLIRIDLQGIILDVDETHGRARLQIPDDAIRISPAPTYPQGGAPPPAANQTVSGAAAPAPTFLDLGESNSDDIALIRDRIVAAIGRIDVAVIASSPPLAATPTDAPPAASPTGARSPAPALATVPQSSSATTTQQQPPTSRPPQPPPSVTLAVADRFIDGENRTHTHLRLDASFTLTLPSLAIVAAQGSSTAPTDPAAIDARQVVRPETLHRAIREAEPQIASALRREGVPAATAAITARAIATDAINLALPGSTGIQIAAAAGDTGFAASPLAMNLTAVLDGILPEPGRPLSLLSADVQLARADAAQQDGEELRPVGASLAPGGALPFAGAPAGPVETAPQGAGQDAENALEGRPDRTAQDADPQPFAAPVQPPSRETPKLGERKRARKSPSQQSATMETSVSVEADPDIPNPDPSDGSGAPAQWIVRLWTPLNAGGDGPGNKLARAALALERKLGQFLSPPKGDTDPDDPPAIEEQSDAPTGSTSDTAPDAAKEG